MPRITKKDKDAVKQYRERVQWLIANTKDGVIDSPDARSARIKRAKSDVKFMVEYYFPHYATSECADFQVQFAKMVKWNPAIKCFAEWPRAHAKSVWVNVFIPFWLMINEQATYMVLIGNNYDKACRLLADLQAELEGNQRIIADFGEQKKQGDWEIGDFTTLDGFTGKALGIGQSVRGLRVKSRRPDYCAGDDIETKETIKNPQRQNDYAKWVERDLIPTMDGPIRRFVWANNRFAPRMIQTVLQERHPNWKVHHIKAYNRTTYAPTWHQKYTADYWRQMEIEIGTLACQAEFNQEPHVEGTIFTDELFRYEKLMRLNSFDQILAYWDVAYSGNFDYNAIKVWGRKGNQFYLIKSFVRQCKMWDAIEWMFVYRQLLPPTVHVNFYYESQFWNDALQMTYGQVRDKYGFDIPLIKDDRPKGKKFDRIVGMLPFYQQGRIIYNIDEKSSNDHQEGVAQLKGIEPGYKSPDDSPDADEGALFKLNRMYNPNDPAQSTSYGKERRSGRW